ncbi:MAG: hypothetical protein IPP40_14465 [bacterium]|nr:hypothetical protein [bacterium]
MLVRIELLRQDAMDATKHALKMIAVAQAAKVSALRRAKMGVLPITAPKSRDVSATTALTTPPREEDVTAVK